jgi:hypothetical protein
MGGGAWPFLVGGAICLVNWPEIDVQVHLVSALRGMLQYHDRKGVEATSAGSGKAFIES